MLIEPVPGPPPCSPYGRCVAPVGSNREVCLAAQETPLALDSKTAAELSGAAAVLHVAIALDAYWVLALGLLDRDVASDVGRIAEAVVAVSVGRAPRVPDISS